MSPWTEPVRVVAITGAPGVGKTALGVQLGRCYVNSTAMVDLDWLSNIWPWQPDEPLLRLIADNLTAVLRRHREWGARIIVVSGVLLPGRVLAWIGHLLEDPEFRWVFYGLRASTETIWSRIAGFTGVQDIEVRMSMAELDSEVQRIPDVRIIQTDHLSTREVLDAVLIAEAADGVQLRASPPARTEPGGPGGLRQWHLDGTRLVCRSEDPGQ